MMTENEALERPVITEFMGDGFTLNKAHKQYLENLELWNYVQALDAYCDSLESKLSEGQPVADTGSGLHLADVNPRYLTQFIKAIKEMNPYPSDVFLEPSYEDWNSIGKFLQEHGKNPDRIFAKWGRMVWENCVGCMEDFNS